MDIQHSLEFSYAGLNSLNLQTINSFSVKYRIPLLCYLEIGT
jgi:hypothetical protein